MPKFKTSPHHPHIDFALGPDALLEFGSSLVSSFFDGTPFDVKGLMNGAQSSKSSAEPLVQAFSYEIPDTLSYSLALPGAAEDGSLDFAIGGSFQGDVSIGYNLPLLVTPYNGVEVLVFNP
mmetsp:Transcript_29420/g.44521  ORF Transcript_29420/g.44521 Transcript_29420/m.44521 type:complete len:121 (+) Transcript_29420:96-458(+)